MKRFTYIRVAMLLALSGTHILVSAQQAPVPSVPGTQVPKLQDKVKLQFAKGTIIGYVSWTNSEEKNSQPSSNLQILSQRQVPKGSSNPTSNWVDTGKITVKSLTKKNGKYTRHFTVTGLPVSVPVTITARTTDAQYGAQQEVSLAPDKGRILSMKLE